jgi:hypothetical protein
LIASCCTHFRVFLISPGFNFQSGIFLYFRVACNVSFDWQLKASNPILYQGAMSFLLQPVALVAWWLLAAPTFVFSSYLRAWVLKVGFFHIFA